MRTSERKTIRARNDGCNTWLESAAARELPLEPVCEYKFSVLDNEDAVGRAMFAELERYATQKSGNIVVVLLGGRGGQAMYRVIREKAETGEIDGLLARLDVFTQDALAPMRMDNGLSFVRDFERLLGPAFFEKVNSFTPMRTDTGDLAGEMAAYIDKLELLGGVDVFFLGLGPEAGAASHLCYIKPDCGATAKDVAGIIPISASILEHHVSKFKVGGSAVSEMDEAECRRATHILTLGPAAILGAKKIVQSIVDASTAPAKRESFARLVNTEISTDPATRAGQLDKNPGLWIRLHPNVASFVLPDLL